MRQQRLMRARDFKEENSAEEKMPWSRKIFIGIALTVLIGTFITSGALTESSM
jgi:hypothetical protein